MEKALKLNKTVTGLTKVQKEVTRIDTHYDGVCKAIVASKGFQVKTLNAQSIYSEHQKYTTQLEAKRKNLLKTNKSPNSNRGVHSSGENTPMKNLMASTLQPDAKMNNATNRLQKVMRENLG